MMVKQRAKNLTYSTTLILTKFIFDPATSSRLKEPQPDLGLYENYLEIDMTL